MKRVFIVDDEVYCIRILNNLIEKYQIPMEICGSAVSGTSAFPLIQKLRPDIVFMDIEMPGLNGLEVIRQLRSTSDYNLHFVIISAYDNFKYAQEAVRLNVTDFLLKPIDNDEFLDMVQRVFGFRFTSNQSFNEILMYVNENFNQDLELIECAAKFHMSTNHVTRLFQKYMGMGFTSYKNKVRLDRSKYLFQETDKSIKEVCEEVGFSNLNYFYRLFKESTGMTPKEYQDNIHRD